MSFLNIEPHLTVAQEAIRVLKLLSRYGACPRVEEDHLTSALFTLINLLSDPTCDPLVKKSCALLFSSLSSFELREESLTDKAILFIDSCQEVISILNLSEPLEESDVVRLADGCLELLAACARASPSCCVKVANVALSCLASRALFPRVVEVLVTAVTSDSPSRASSFVGPCASDLPVIRNATLTPLRFRRCPGSQKTASCHI